jgi:hypothetical protein
MPAMTGKRCDGPHDAPCFGGGTCKACWREGDCPTADGNVTFSWTPTAGQAGTHVICVDATVQRDTHLCQVPEPFSTPAPSHSLPRPGRPLSLVTSTPDPR